MPTTYSNAAMMNALVDANPQFNDYLLQFMTPPGETLHRTADDGLTVRFITRDAAVLRREIQYHLDGVHRYLATLESPYETNEIIARATVARRATRTRGGTVVLDHRTSCIVVCDRALLAMFSALRNPRRGRWVAPVYMDPSRDSPLSGMEMEQTEDALYNLISSWAARRSPRTQVATMAVASAIGAVLSAYGYVDGNIWWMQPSTSAPWTTSIMQFGGPGCVMLNMLRSYTNTDARPVDMVDRNCEEAIPVVSRFTAALGTNPRATWERDPRMRRTVTRFAWSALTGDEPTTALVEAAVALASARIEGRPLAPLRDGSMEVV